MSMGLKQDVVVVNEFTIPLPSAKGRKRGTRGGTPGEFVTRYMARELATESLAPIRRQRTDDFIVRYMAREEATEAAGIRDRGSLKRKMTQAQGQGGVAFGYGQVSLSHDQLQAASADIQRLFDEGHTVMKTVLSFDQEYLRKHGIIPDDFVCKKRGDYRGHIDQMKLRLAVMHGLNRMGTTLYDDLRYVGVVQVDTEHVHCHLAMVDAGRGSLASDGTQRGKIGDRAKSLLRRGVDAWLDAKKVVRHLTSAVGYERRNVTTFVKRWAHQQMLRESLPQFLLACLPEDRRLWRSGTNHEAMRKPNRIVHQIVREVLDRDGSPMTQAMTEVRAYADHRRQAESLTQGEWDRLVKTGEQRIVERSVNAVYGLLRGLPEDALRVRTPMLDAMGADYEVIAERAHADGDQDDLVGFGFRLRSFASRLEHHTELREQYHRMARSWENADDQGQATASSRALYELYLEEEQYHARCASKYRSFLAFTPPSATWYQEWEEVSEYGERVISLESMRRDQSLRRTKDEAEAERVGREVYGQAGGRLVARGDDAAVRVLEERVRRMRSKYTGMVADLRVSLAGKGLLLGLKSDPATGRDSAEVVAAPEFPFEEVKGLDLHHMRYDFAQDVKVGSRTLKTFTEAAAHRSEALDAAVSYLVQSGQGEAVAELPVSDIRAMARLAADVASDPDALLPSHVAELAREQAILRRSRTVRLGATLAADLEAQVDQVALAATPSVDEPGTDVETIPADENERA